MIRHLLVNSCLCCKLLSIKILVYISFHGKCYFTTDEEMVVFDPCNEWNIKLPSREIDEFLLN